jgi:hypothetical protein
VTPDRIFSHLYLDEDVSVLIAALLRPHGFDVLTTREGLNLGQSDSFQLLFATAQRRAILTHNRGDFESLHRSALAEQQSKEGWKLEVRG